MKKLDELKIPQASKEARQRTIKMSLDQYDQSSSNQQYLVVFWRGVAVASLLLLVTLGYFNMGSNSSTNPQVANLSNQENQTILAETKSLFNKNLAAVVKQDGMYDVVLANSDNNTQEEPIIVTLEKGGKKTQIISFNGQNLDLNLAGKQISLELLLSGDGNVIVIGDDFIWSQASSTGLSDYEIHAEEL